MLLNKSFSEIKYKSQCCKYRNNCVMKEKWLKVTKSDDVKFLVTFRSKTYR